jgi:hypothetical protein
MRCFLALGSKWKTILCPREEKSWTTLIKIICSFHLKLLRVNRHKYNVVSAVETRCKFLKTSNKPITVKHRKKIKIKQYNRLNITRTASSTETGLTYTEQGSLCFNTSVFVTLCLLSTNHILWHDKSINEFLRWCSYECTYVLFFHFYNRCHGNITNGF